MRAKIDLTGKKFGRLTVVSEHGRTRKNSVTWDCVCDCGNRKIVIGYDLRSGNTSSCGCFQREGASRRRKTHGMTGTKTYRAWEDMKKRCYNKNNKRYKTYGGRGIMVCERWHNFDNFLSDMGESEVGMSIERIDNDKNYEPGNCKWASRQEQMRNTTRTRNIEFNGKVQCVSAWASELGVDPDTLLARLKYGWSIEKTMTTPVRVIGRSL
jgi:hypothetical protein